MASGSVGQGGQGQGKDPLAPALPNSRGIFHPAVTGYNPQDSRNSMPVTVRILSISFLLVSSFVKIFLHFRSSIYVSCTVLENQSGRCYYNMIFKQRLICCPAKDFGIRSRLYTFPLFRFNVIACFLACLLCILTVIN